MFTIFDYFKRHVQQNPEKILWEDNNKAYSVSEIEILSGKVYRYLKDSGIGKEDIVSIRLPRSANIFIVMLGVWKAGAAFHVIGAHSPSEYVSCQIKETKPCLIFDTVCLEEAMNCSYLAGNEKTDSHNLACIVYSSGSTGIFKGSMHEYGEIQKVVNRAFAFCDFYKFTAIAPDEYRILFEEGFYTLGAVFTLVDTTVLFYYRYVLPYESIGKIEEIKKVLIDKKINSYCATTRNYEKIKNMELLYMKELSVTMDMISCTYSPDCPVFNYYGMSESIPVLCCFKVDKDYDITPVGKPYKDISMKIADKEGNPVSDGQIGEICFIPEFWRGYIARPEQTKKVFYDGWFHTGDMGYVNKDGNYVVVGRKIDIADTKEGFIVPVFIEVKFRKVFPDVEKCHVQIFNTETDPIVCLYYCGKTEYSTDEVRNRLAKVIPEYSLPDRCRKMKEFIYFPSGKLNRNSFLLF